jgi:hypothetical protein
MNFQRRLKSLEGARSPISQQVFRVVRRSVCGEPNLANSTWTRRLGANGLLMEMVKIDGTMNNEGLEQFIQRFPIERE